MSEKTLMKFVVQELTQYGFKTPEGAYVSKSKFCTATEFVPGTVIEAEVYISPTGKMYVNKVVSTEAIVTSDAISNTTKKKITKTPAEAKKAMGITDVPAKTYTPRDYDKEARGKTFSQMLAAALVSQAVNSLSNNLEELLDNANVVANKAFSLVFKNEEYKG